MKATLAAVFAVLLFSPAFAAQYTAYFMPEPFPFSGLNGSFEGHFGDYWVEAGAGSPFPYISISGRNASADNLALELDYLKNMSLLSSNCSALGISIQNSTDIICTPEGWGACPQDGSCRLSEPNAPAAAPTAASQETNGAPSPLHDTLGIAAGSRAAMKTGGAGNEAADAAAPAQSGIGLEQLLQLAGALIAVVVASYLILQQRQVQLEIDPQEEKLLDNATRAGIMQELSGADRIPTDLSIKLGKSKATVVEHLTTLSSAGFVERVATPGRKYVFYRLTQKGKRALLRRAG
ncbi:MAG: winged helix-turn-helix domain-containing protein [Candidatus Micrarchaeia archaeon]